MNSGPPRIMALRHELHAERINRVLVVVESAPVAKLRGAQLLMLDWWRRSKGYPVGRLFGTIAGLDAEPRTS